MERTLGISAETKQALEQCAATFRLPRYNMLPNIGLYLDQVVQYVNSLLEPAGFPPITSSMVSNYVKSCLISNPVKKRYYADQISRLLFIATTKTVLSMDNVQLLLGIQQSTYPLDVAYNYFCDQLERAIASLFTDGHEILDSGTTQSEEKALLRYAVLAIADVAYITKLLDLIRAENQEQV